MVDGARERDYRGGGVIRVREPGSAGVGVVVPLIRGRRPPVRLHA